MRLGRLLIVIAIVIILGVVAIYALLNLNATPSGQSQVPPTTNVVMVVQPIERGHLITEEQLGYLAYPTSETISSFFTDISQVVGKRARFDIDPATPLTTSMILSSDQDFPEGGSDTALLIPDGMVAFPIPIDRFSSLAYGLREGDHVNIIATMLLVDVDPDLQTKLPNDIAVISVDPTTNVLSVLNVDGGNANPQGATGFESILGQPFYVVPSEAQRPRIVSQTILQNITVLHVGNFYFTDPNGDVITNAYGTTVTDANGVATIIPDAPDIITLIVSPQDAITLNYLVYAGSKLNLALRPSGDETTVTTQAVTLEYLLSTYDIPVPSKLPFGLQPSVDILTSPTQQLALPQAPAQ